MEQSEVPEATLVHKMAPMVVGAAIVAAIGTGIGTWHLVNVNSGKLVTLEARVTVMERFAKEGKRCTFRDCVRLETQMRILEARLAQHREKVAHREALERIKSLEAERK